MILRLLLALAFLPALARAQIDGLAAEQPAVVAVPTAAAARPDHRITVKFSATERGFTKLTAPIVFTFDSGAPDTYLFNQNYFLEGHASQDATGNIWRSWLKPTPFGEPERSLRIVWWRYRYSDGSVWTAGAILSDSIEAPLGRLRGTMEVALCEPDGTVIQRYPSGIANIGIQTGFSFSFGEPRRFLAYGTAKYWLNNFGAAGGQLPPDKMFAPQTRPDAIGSNGEWLPKWTPRRIDLKNADGSYQFPQYWNASDPRNPPIGSIIGEIEVPSLYEDQTHAHMREQFSSPAEKGWQAHERSGNKKGTYQVYRWLYQWNARQIGCWSPRLGAPYWIDGRPIFLAGLDGWMPDAGVRYRLTATDQNALKPWIGHEGRIEITKGNLYQFPEAFGQDYGKPLSENVVLPLELAGGRFAGLYSATQAWDLEHGGTENVAVACWLLADPTAMMHLHHWAEEYITGGLVKHSSRQVGWMIATEAYAYLVFRDKPSFAGDAQRYLDYARMVGSWVYNARLDETAYQGLVGRNYESRDLSIPEEQTGGFEAAFQSAVALNAFTMMAQIDPDSQWRGLWLALTEYTANLYLQPGIIQRPTPTFKGGVLDSWNLLGPKPDSGEWAGKSIEERLRANSGTMNGIDWLADQGWCGPALAKAARVLKAAGRPSWQAIDTLAREIRGYQAAQVYYGIKILSPQSEHAWGMYADTAATYGWPQ